MSYLRKATSRPDVDEIEHIRPLDEWLVRHAKIRRRRGHWFLWIVPVPRRFGGRLASLRALKIAGAWDK